MFELFNVLFVSIVTVIVGFVVSLICTVIFINTPNAFEPLAFLFPSVSLTNILNVTLCPSNTPLPAVGVKVKLTDPFVFISLVVIL